MPTVVRWTVVAGPIDDRELLSEHERARLGAMRLEADRRRFVAARVLLRAAVAEVTGRDLRDVVLRQTCKRCGGPHGRLEAAVGARRVEVSLSHAGALAVVAVGSRPVGVDVEPLLGPGGPAVGDDELRTWVRTEAVLKATGHGLEVDPAHLRLSAPATPPRLVTWQGPGRRPRMRLADLDLAPGHVAAVARSGRRPLRLDVREVVLRRAPPGAAPPDPDPGGSLALARPAASLRSPEGWERLRS
jgi:4'-phosphopantetheinyl transferase